MLTAAILSSASDILNLYPARHRAVVFLLSAFDDFYQEGQGEKAAKEIISLLENRNEDVLIASREGWPLEKRFLLLQFPHVLPHICPSETWLSDTSIDTLKFLILILSLAESEEESDEED